MKRKHTVLLADDDKVQTMMLSAQLRAKGAISLAVVNAAKATGGADGPEKAKSVVIGNNPMQMYFGAQESIIGSSHYVIKLTNGAGGVDRVPGDYLFRDTAAAGMGGGAWGIVRVAP